MSHVYVVESDAIITRNKAEQIASAAKEQECSAIDLINVEFVSRSVADELNHHSKQYDLELVNVQDPVQSLLDVVSGDPQATA